MEAKGNDQWRKIHTSHDDKVALILKAHRALKAAGAGSFTMKDLAKRAVRTVRIESRTLLIFMQNEMTDAERVQIGFPRKSDPQNDGPLTSPERLARLNQKHAD